MKNNKISQINIWHKPNASFYDWHTCILVERDDGLFEKIRKDHYSYELAHLYLEKEAVMTRINKEDKKNG